MAHTHAAENCDIAKEYTSVLYAWVSIHPLGLGLQKRILDAVLHVAAVCDSLRCQICVRSAHSQLQRAHRSCKTM